MNRYTEDELLKKYDEFIDYIKLNFKGERLKKLLHMYDHDQLGERLILAPASGKEWFHNAYIGGYMDHVMNVCHTSVGVKKLYEHIGGHIDFTDEELAFSALHHDLGKLGDLNGEYYTPQTSDWHREKMGEIFKVNNNIDNMDVTHRALFLLQHYDIKITQKEWIGIFLADGLYAEHAKKYYMTNIRDCELKSNLPHILHVADLLSCKKEYDLWKFSEK